jgi:histidine triad (HIT) family protein
MPTIFTRILTGEIPGEFVFRAPRWIGLCDISPSAPGHCLLVPVAEADHLHELPLETLAELGPHLARLTAAVRVATGCQALNVIINDGRAAGQEVPHVHLHVIPRWAEDGKTCGLFGGSRATATTLSAMGTQLRAAWGQP